MKSKLLKIKKDNDIQTIIVSVLALFFLFILILYLEKRSNIQPKNNQNNQNTTNDTTSEILENSDEQSYTHKIILDFEDRKVIVFENNYTPEIYIWKNYIFIPYDHETALSEGKVLRQINMKTGEEKGLIAYISEDRNSNNITQFFEVNDDLVIILDDYMQPKRVYKFTKSNPEGEIIENANFNRIETIGDNYVAVNSFGDGCGGNADYYYLDVNTYTTEHIKEFAGGCVEGPETLGSYENYIIFADRTPIHDSGIVYTQYDNLKIIDTTPPFEEIILINEFNVIDRVHFDNEETIYFITDYLEKYNLSTRQRAKIVDLPDIFRNSFIYGIDEESICLSYENTDKEYKLMFSDGSYAESECYINPNLSDSLKTKTQIESDVRQKLDKFDIPSNFHYFVDRTEVRLKIDIIR